MDKPSMPGRPVNAVPPSNRYTARKWDEVRRAFFSSIMVDTSLASLAQNLEGLEWPLQGPEEKPAFYIDLEFEQLLKKLALKGQPAIVADQLIDILNETLAFDDPFGEMVVHTETVPVTDNPLVKNLSKLEIPLGFPVTLTALSPDTLFFCKHEDITTLGEFAIISQRMAGSIVIGGDFRALLNALSHIDERALARFLPFRVGEKGLHYIEGLAQAVRSQPVPVQTALAHRLLPSMPKAARELAATVSQQAISAARASITQYASSLRLYCGDDYAEITKKIAAGANPSTIVAVLADPVIEAIVADLLKPAKTKVRQGVFARFFGFIRK